MVSQFLPVTVGGKVTEQEDQAFRRRCCALLARDDGECPRPDPKSDYVIGLVARSKSRNLLERLRDYETETLRVLTIRACRYDESENDIRITKVQQ